MTLQSSEVSFQALEPLQPQWPLQPQQPQWPQWPQRPHFIINFTDPDNWIIPSTQMIKTSPFLWNGSSKIQFFYWYLIPFLSEAVEASWCYFFFKCPNLLKPLGTIIQQNNWSFYPSESFSFIHFNMIHPVQECFFYYMESTTEQR